MLKYQCYSDNKHLVRLEKKLFGIEMESDSGRDPKIHDNTTLRTTQVYLYLSEQLLLLAYFEA